MGSLGGGEGADGAAGAGGGAGRRAGAAGAGQGPGLGVGARPGTHTHTCARGYKLSLSRTGSHTLTQATCTRKDRGLGWRKGWGPRMAEGMGASDGADKPWMGGGPSGGRGPPRVGHSRTTSPLRWGTVVVTAVLVTAVGQGLSHGGGADHDPTGDGPWRLGAQSRPRGRARRDQAAAASRDSDDSEAAGQRFISKAGRGEATARRRQRGGGGREGGQTGRDGRRAGPGRGGGRGGAGSITATCCRRWA